MTMDPGTLKPEDYVEPRCLLCEEPYGKASAVRAVPQQRIVEKMDEYLSRKDYKGAERHLFYWLEEARLGGDLRGQLTIRNELVGHYRKQGQKEKAYESIQEALRLLAALEMEGTISEGTTCTNVATAYYRFGDYEKCLPYFEKARSVYEAHDRTDPALLGGLYNNHALACVAVKDYSRAYELYQKAMDVMETVPMGTLEQAITCLNLANALEADQGMEAAEPEIYHLLDQAEALLESARPEQPEVDSGQCAGRQSPQEAASSGNAAEQLSPQEAAEAGYYAFVCESCAPTFSYYGYFMTAEELKRRAKEIYDRNGTVEGLL